MEKVAVCRGDRGGVCYHVYDGYFYRNDSTNERVYKYLHCTTNGCPGRAVMPTAVEDRFVNNFKMTTLHNHQPNIKNLYVSNVKERILMRCESEFTPLKQIFDEEMAKAPEEIHGMLLYQSYKTTMSRIRRSIKSSLLSVLQDDIENSETDNVEELENQQELTNSAEGKQSATQQSLAHAYKTLHKQSKQAEKKQKYAESKGQIVIKEEEQYDEYIEGDESYVEDGQEYEGEVYLEGEEVYLEEQEEGYEDENDEHYSGEVSYLDYISEGGSEDEANYDNYVEHEIEILTSEDVTSEIIKHSPVSKKSPSKEPNSTLKNEQIRHSLPQTEFSEDVGGNLHKYLQFNKNQPNNQSGQFDDLLAMFFKEIEATVRSFHPSVMIDAKGKISNLVNRLEMRDWRVKEKLKKQKQLDQQLQELQQKEHKMEQQRRDVIQKQRLDKQLQEQKLKQQNVQKQQETQKSKQQEYGQLQNQQPTQQFKELQQKQQDLLKKQQEILERQKEQLLLNQQASEQVEHLEIQQIEVETEQQEFQEIEVSQLIAAKDVESQPMVLQYNPKVSVVYLPDTNLVSSTPIAKRIKLEEVEYDESNAQD